jgi:signal recognition particle receptor subunit beta
MVSMKTQSDRTLFFDLLPLDLGEIMGFKTRFLLYTVPGQVFYNATRKLVLKGADAIVFVADSEVGKMEENKESLGNLRANLAEYNLNLDQIPWVIQYNKRDLPNIYTLDELNAELNLGGKVPFFEAVATEGKGVFETFRGISHLLMEKVTKDLRRSPSATTTSRSAAVEEPAPPPPAKATPATPMAPPARSIQREALATPDLVGESAGGGLEYGREIELPDSIPPSTRARTVPAHPPASAPTATAQSKTPARRATDIGSEPSASSRIPSGPVRQPAAPSHAEGVESNGAAIVIPIQIPRGAGREIVLRIVISSED